MYTDTSGRLAKDSDTSVPTISLYARMGLLDYVVASNGVKLFRAGQAPRVREILRERMARRGRQGAHAA